LSQNRKARIQALLKSIETGDPAPIAVVNQAKYIQHNPQTHEGSEGLEALFKRLSETSPRVNIVRAFEDGDYVFAHTEYDFARSNIGFEVFRFEGDHVVEHWDNIQQRQGPNPAGLTMVDGPTEATDHDLTETNRNTVRDFVESVLVRREIEELGRYFNGPGFIQHNPQSDAGVAALHTALNARNGSGFMIEYTRLHRVLAEGNFVLAVSEGSLNGVHSSLYDLYRVSEGKLVEHWDTIEKIPPRSAWKNDNGKF
jgi:predicted SnoaL-like aldol condensation-catalyzing enzyme